MKRIAAWISLAAIVFFALGEVPTSHSEPMPPSLAETLPLSKVVLYFSTTVRCKEKAMSIYGLRSTKLTTCSKASWYRMPTVDAFPL